ncbi:MAG: class I SAM-dependent methyltransferase [Lentisphaerae bacterium]|nr:class I SAM-dependent methyltransferase [Lentisphaerota bacterium]MCP4102720.1 class I SAM-dependent methyltransferase [Lentisphaerota bacterium]
MDLTTFNIAPTDAEKAKSILNYQPFIISDTFQTGCGYSFCHSGDPRVDPPLSFDRNKCTEDVWAKATRANRGVAAMYDDQIKLIAELFPGKSLLDFACNNGYFPVAAEVAGMKNCAGIDSSDYGECIKLLNKVTGSNAQFIQGLYDSEHHHCKQLENEDGEPVTWDVVCASAIMCHMPDPLSLLRFLSRHAREAVFFWGQVLTTDKYLVSYDPPHLHLSALTDKFPVCFNDNTRLSISLMEDSMSWLGFSHVIEIKAQDSWVQVKSTSGNNLEDELNGGSPHRALLFVRNLDNPPVSDKYEVRKIGCQ